ncbi:hypothetical protein [Streptomyces sp. NPDC091371]|uniref:hypothetical protein n=1 Tax=Streptomyces sp. NPDC091371 TaxID=3155303 RepID=UPI0034309EEA
MRIKMITTVTAVTALLTLTTACGGGGSQGLGGLGGDSVAANGEGDGGPDEGTLANPSKNGGVNGGAPKNGTAFQKLPKAGTMAGAAGFVGGYMRCPSVRSVSPSPEPDPSESYAKPSYNEKWSVKETGDCGRGNRILMLKDAKAFQTAYKAWLDTQLPGNPNEDLRGGGFIIGQDFAVTGGDSDATGLVKQGGLLLLNCNPKFTTPSGFRKEPALVKGCVLTDYFND